MPASYVAAPAIEVVGADQGSTMASMVGQRCGLIKYIFKYKMNTRIHVYDGFHNAPLKGETIMIRRLRMLIVAAIALAGVVGAAIVTSRTMAQVPPTPGSVTYRYDSIGWIMQDVYPANSAAYNYDAAGNRTSFTIN